MIHDQLATLVGQMVDRGVYLEDALREFQRHFITLVLEHCDGNLTKSADALGVHRNTLSRKIRELRIRRR